MVGRAELAAADDAPHPFRVFVSSIHGPPPPTREALGGFLGYTDYSYSFSMRGFLDAFVALGLDVQIVRAAENVADVRRASPRAVNVHFGFYPPDKPRLLKGAYNIVVTAWEFERLRRPYEHVGHHAFADTARSLNLADEVWAVSSYGAAALARSGVENVRHVGSPVLAGVRDRARSSPPDAEEILAAASDLDRFEWFPLAIAPVIQSVLSAEARRRRRPLRALLREACGPRRPLVFLAVFNIADWRKQILPLLEAFTRFARMAPNALLLLKINTTRRGWADINENLYGEQVAVSGELAPPLVSDRVWLANEPLTDAELGRLYDLAAYYVSTAHAEGQNLPLIEAMGRGVVAVSVGHTAMADYLSDSNAIIIPSASRPFNARLRARYEMGDISTFYVAAPDVHDALARASALEDAAYADFSRAGLTAVKTKFGLAPFRAAVQGVAARAGASLSAVV